MIYRTIILAALIATQGRAAEPRVFLAPGEAERLERYLGYLSLPRITETKIDMILAAASLCRPGGSNSGPHLKPGIHLYANTRALEKAGHRTEGAQLPIGSLLVKEKFEDKTDSVPSIITVMEKITNRGKVDDWLFYMIRLSDRSFVREQPAASCVGCHSKYVKTDFVSSTTFSLLTAHAKKSLEKD